MLLWLLVLCTVHIVSGQWGYSQDEIDVFDLADEIKANFYEFVGVPQDATSSEIRRAYRKLSLTMHPDKNKTEGAEENFRLLVAVNEVLKNKEQREIYDNVLVNGIPSAYLYVPKPMRKMSLTEVSIILACTLTLGHYLVLWGMYAEKRIALEEILPRLRKKKMKSKKKGEYAPVDDIDNLPDQVLQKPKFMEMLPIAIVCGLYRFMRFLPWYVKKCIEENKRKKEEEEQRRLEEEEAIQMYQDEQIKREEQKQWRKERSKERREEMLKFVETSITNVSPSEVFSGPSNSLEDLEEMYDEWSDSEGRRKKKKNKREWTPGDEHDLIKLMTKYPAGTAERWQLIAEDLNKAIHDVISKAKHFKNKLGTERPAQSVGLKAPKKEVSSLIPDDITVRDASGYDNEEHANETIENANDSWSQVQQKQLETAIQQFPKGTSERWDKIAACVPLKSKEDCTTRYKYLASKIQQKKKQS